MSKLTTSTPIVEEDLHAFVDGALDVDRRREVQDHLDRNPDAAATVADLASQRQLLRSGLAHIADEPLPERLLMSTLVANRRRPSPWAWQTAAAVVLALGTGIFGGWQMHGAAGQPGSGIMLAGWFTSVRIPRPRPASRRCCVPRASCPHPASRTRRSAARCRGRAARARSPRSRLRPPLS